MAFSRRGRLYAQKNVLCAEGAPYLSPGHRPLFAPGHQSSPKGARQATEAGWQYAAKEENPAIWPDYEWALPHYFKQPVINICFVDGHVESVNIRRKPKHYNNEDYDLCQP